MVQGKEDNIKYDDDIKYDDENETAIRVIGPEGDEFI